MEVLVRVFSGVVDSVVLGPPHVLQRLAEEWEKEDPDNDAPIIPLEVTDPGSGPDVERLAQEAVEEMGDIFYDPIPDIDGVTAEDVLRSARECVQRAILKALGWKEAIEQREGSVTVVLHLRGMAPERLVAILDDYFSNNIFTDADFGDYALCHPLAQDDDRPYVADWAVFTWPDGADDEDDEKEV